MYSGDSVAVDKSDFDSAASDTCQRYRGIVCAAVLATQLVDIPSKAYQSSVEQHLIGQSVRLSDVCLSASLSVVSGQQV